MFPPISPVELTLVLLAEFLFGIGFNALDEWTNGKKVESNHADLPLFQINA